jgi:hypothetical protein
VPGNPRIRASDADRDRATALLREHHAAGRLTAEEFHERMDKALDAKTLGEIDELMADLPAIDLYQLPAASLRRTPPGTRPSLVPTDRHGETSPATFPPGTAALAAWAGVTLVLGAVWVAVAVITGVWFPWWALIAIPWFWVLVRRMRRGRE